MPLLGGYNEHNLSSVFGAAGAYDFVNLMVDAYEYLYKDGEKPSADEITAYIQSKKKYGCMSGECVVENNGFITTQPRFRFCKDNKWQYID